MGQHRARWHLAPTFALAVIMSSGVVGVAMGPLFTRPTVEFGSSAGVGPFAGGQVGAVERATAVAPAPAPTRKSRPAAIPPPAAGRDVQVATAPTSPTPRATAPETANAAEGWPPTLPSSSPPAPSESPTAEQADPEQQPAPRCGWSE